MRSQPVASGYSCQASLSLLVARDFGGGQIRWWFASDFLPVVNNEGSQPIKIYQWLHEAHSSGSVTAKTYRLRAALLDWIEHLHEEGVLSDVQRKQAYRLIVETNDRIAMQPAVYYLCEIGDYEKESEPDEYRSGLLPLNSKAIHKVLPHRLDLRRTDIAIEIGSGKSDIDRW